jgi:hypothetical protein
MVNCAPLSRIARTAPERVVTFTSSPARAPESGVSTWNVRSGRRFSADGALSTRRGGTLLWSGLRMNAK